MLEWFHSLSVQCPPEFLRASMRPITSSTAGIAMRATVRFFVLVVLAAAHLTAGAADQLARLTGGNGFFAEPKVDMRVRHTCQPLKGERVVILGIQPAVEGMPGLNLAKVRVLDGQCTGKLGWVGTAVLEAVQR